MSLDITFKHRKKHICPRCGEILGDTDIRSASSGGRVWYDFLQSIGYYVPHDKRTDENDWYGKDMILTPEQAKAAYKYVIKRDVFCRDDVCGLIATALFENDCVVVNADW